MTTEMVTISKQLKHIGSQGLELQRRMERAGEIYRDGMRRLEADYIERMKRAVDALTTPAEDAANGTETPGDPAAV